MKHTLARIALLSLMILFVFLPTRAQDATAEAALEAQPVSVVGEGTAPSITCQEGATCNLNEAPGETLPVPTSSTTEILGIAGVIAIVIVLTIGLVFGPQIIGYLSKLVPPETAASIYESGVRFGYQIALNQAASTANKYDDEFVLSQARGRGYTVTSMPDGSYHLEPPKFTTTSTAPLKTESAVASSPAAFQDGR